MTRRTHLARRRLLAAARRLDSDTPGSAAALAQLLVGDPKRPFDPNRPSPLNGDGSPLQLCITSDRGGTRLRMLGDPCAGIAHPGEQVARARATTAEVLEAHAPELAPVAARLHELAPGAVWLAAARDGGAAVYFDALAEGWVTARTRLEAILQDPTVALEVSRRLEARAIPASVAIEGSCLADARAKLYVRLREPAPLAELGLALFDAPVVSRFLELVIADREIDLEGLVLGVGFRLADGGLTDVKIDVCGHCLAYDSAEWIAVERELNDALDMTTPTLAAVLDGDVDVAFVGLGLTTEGATRLNVYLKAAVNDGLPSRARVGAALADGVAGLVAAQGSDGSFVDYDLPVGRSDQWVTAYVGRALAEAGAPAAAHRAARWLLDNRTYAAGWGFNATTGADADSTALALALFRKLGIATDPTDVAFVGTHLRDGGFATYNRADGWGEPHADVTPLAFAALPDSVRRALAPDLLRYLDRARGEDGLWPSYWWRDPSYATFRVLALLGDEALLPRAIRPGRLEPQTAFQLACTLGVEHLRRGAGAPRDALVRALLRLQRPSGRWDGSAELRVTDPASRTGDGRYYEDSGGLIATATAVEALALTLRASGSRRPLTAHRTRGGRHHAQSISG